MSSENSKVFLRILIGCSILFIIIITFLYLTVTAKREDYQELIRGISDTLHTGDTPYIAPTDTIK